MVEESHTTTGNVRNNSVKYSAATLVSVETVVQELPEATAALRHTKSIRKWCRRFVANSQWILL
jgi:hypothetical protein